MNRLSVLFRRRAAGRRAPLALWLFVFFACPAAAQTYETEYRQPLDSVLKQIETRFGVHLHYNEATVKDRTVSYAGWRFRSDLKTTLDNILIRSDLVAYKKNDTAYNIEPFRYWQRQVEEGKAQLDTFAATYKTVAAWEARKAELRDCIFTTLKLKTLPAWPASAPIVTPKRSYNGYSVQNIALETLPGLFVCGSLYSPLQAKGKIPVILCPNGHFGGGRYRPDQQYRCASLARMGALVFSYDLLAWGESQLQFRYEDHFTSAAMTVQVLNNFRILDYLTSLKAADTARVGITGASGGGSQTMLLTALTDRIKVSAPVVMLSCYFNGGCPCETGLPIHWCGGGTNNVEIAAMAAPRPQLVISDGKDWTDHVPEIEFPFLQTVYGFYHQAGRVKNVHLPTDDHDYGFSKRKPMYAFMAENLGLNLSRIQNKNGDLDESTITIEPEQKLYVFGNEGKAFPARAITGIAALRTLLNETLKP